MNIDVAFGQGGIDHYRVEFLGEPPEGFSAAPLDIEFLQYFLDNRQRALTVVPRLAELADAEPNEEDILLLVLPNFINHEEGRIFTAYFMCLLAENYRMMRIGTPSFTKYKVKMLAFYQVMFENMIPTEAANYPRRRDISWQDILREHNRLFNLHPL
ncbi:hypothetical protein [Deinococcus sp. PESE-13]